MKNKTIILFVIVTLFTIFILSAYFFNFVSERTTSKKCEVGGISLNLPKEFCDKKNLVITELKSVGIEGWTIYEPTEYISCNKKKCYVIR